MSTKITKSINCRGQLISFDEPKIMGILNITPDSFYDGGKHLTIKKQLQQVKQMLLENKLQWQQRKRT